MKILNLVQGSAEWKEVRTKYCVASEAPVIMGASPHMKRDELLRLKSSGLEREVNEWVEKFIFGRGHEVEYLARPIAEARLGDDLYQLTGVVHVSGLDLLASYDGITAPLYDMHWEHKQFNKELFELVKSGGELEPKHYWQLEHQLLVNGNDSCIFAVSDGTEANYAQLVYHSRPERREQLIHGWKLFLVDLESYVAPKVIVKAVGEVIKSLPALTVDIVGEVKSSNLVLYKNHALDFINKVKTDLKTDEDFATAKNVIEFCDRVENELKVTKNLILSKAQSIEEVMRTIDEMIETHRQKRLQLNKLVEAEEARRKAAMVTETRQSWLDHMKDLQDQIVKLNPALSMPDIPVNFAGAIKNKRTTETMRSALNDELARARIEANRMFDRIIMNINTLSMMTDKKFLFGDLKDISCKETDHFKLIVQSRLDAHEASERERIQAEAKRIADEQLEKERAQAEAPAQIQLGNETLNQQFNEVFADYKPTPKKTEHNQFQAGVVYGLELALSIYTNRGPKAFLQSVEHFITSDCIPEAPEQPESN